MACGWGTGHSHGRGTVFGGPWPWALRKKRHENEREHVLDQPPGTKGVENRSYSPEPHTGWLGVGGGNYFRALGRGGGLLRLAALLRSTRAGLETQIFDAPAKWTETGVGIVPIVGTERFFIRNIEPAVATEVQKEANPKGN